MKTRAKTCEPKHKGLCGADPVPTYCNSAYTSTNPKHLTEATNVARLITKIDGEDTTN